MTDVLKISAVALLTACSTLAICGCAQQLQIPGSATQVSLGTGNTGYRAAQSGMVYVYDSTWNKVRYSGYLRAGQMLSVDARNDRILIDGLPVVEQVALDDNAQYQIFLDRTATVRTTTVVEHQPVIEHHEVITPGTTVVRRETMIEPGPSTTVERKTVIEREVQDR